MQNIDLICVGKLNAKYFAEGVAEYQKRLAAFASFRIIELPEEKIEEKNASDAVVKKALDKEGKAILGSVRKGAAIVAMCIEGKQISSDELAQFLADRANSGAGDVAFVIGSSHGLSDEVKRAAALKFSMGRITMPHQLARLVLTEQIYRACTINAGMKYHKCIALAEAGAVAENLSDSYFLPFLYDKSDVLFRMRGKALQSPQNMIK